MIFLAASGFFLLYDLAVNYKHNFIGRTDVHSARIIDSFFPADYWDRLFQAEETFPMEIVSIHKKMNRARRSYSATSLEFVKSIFPERIIKEMVYSATSLEFLKSIVPEPINKEIAKLAAIMKQFLVPPADSDEKVDIDENSIYTVDDIVGPENIAYSFSCATVMFADIAGFTIVEFQLQSSRCLPTVGTTFQGV